MSDEKLFSIALGYMLKNEGGYNHIEGDKGGQTNFGVSLAFLKSLDEEDADINKDGLVNGNDIKELTLDNVYDIYREYFWDRYIVPLKTHEYFGLVEQRDEFWIYLFDMYVNHSPRGVGLMLQRAINACEGDTLVEDGLVGSATKNALAGYSREKQACLEVALRSERRAYYRELVAKDDTQQKFIKGWRNRALRKP